MLRIFGARLVPQRTIVVFNKTYTSGKGGQSSTPKPEVNPDVPGLSSKIVNVPNTPVGFRGATKDSEYKCPEYFCYNVDSFAEAFIEMDKFRLPAPANPNKKHK